MNIGMLDDYLKGWILIQWMFVMNSLQWCLGIFWMFCFMLGVWLCGFGGKVFLFVSVLWSGCIFCCVWCSFVSCMWIIFQVCFLLCHCRNYDLLIMQLFSAESLVVWLWNTPLVSRFVCCYARKCFWSRIDHCYEW